MLRKNLAAALWHGIGSDAQRPFTIVIVGVLITVLLLGVILLPTLYAKIARRVVLLGDSLRA